MARRRASLSAVPFGLKRVEDGPLARLLLNLNPNPRTLPGAMDVLAASMTMVRIMDGAKPQPPKP